MPSLITSQFDTAPKLDALVVEADVRLITSQFDTAPKRKGNRNSRRRV